MQMQANGQTGTEAAGQVLYMALELSNRKWKLGFSDGSKLRKRTVTAGDVEKPERGCLISQLGAQRSD